MNGGRKVVFATPTIQRPYPAYLASMEAMVGALDDAGWEHSTVFEVGNPYISGARAAMLRKAMDARADIVVFIDHDIEFRPQDMLRLLATEGDVVAGTYRNKEDEETYMGGLVTEAPDHRPIVRKDGAILGERVPAGFLKITKEAVNRFMGAYPELIYGERFRPSVDLFNHGAIDGLWWGEDYAFSKRWREKCGEIWIVPDLNLTHWKGDKPYAGNFHQFLMRQPGGANDPARKAA